MKYLSNWQPLVNEDRHTALVFGFMRHAPVEAALNPWLSSVLGRPVEAKPLAQGSFWPTLPSVFPGSVTTEPELVFDADDGASLTVVVEVKPGYGMLGPDQICREVVDVAEARGVSRIACVMVGADLDAPMDLGHWSEKIGQALHAYLPGRDVTAELAYSSFASLGRAAQQCASSSAGWSAYAEDVVAQLRAKGLLGYDGAPMLDDLERLTVPNAVQAFNQSMRAARGFFLQLHGQPRFQNLGLAPYAKEHRMYRNGLAVTPTSPAEAFETTVVVSYYRHPSWDAEHVLFVCFDLLGTDGSHADLVIGACHYTDADYITYGFTNADTDAEPTTPALRDYDGSVLPITAAEARSEWRFDRRPWKPGQAEEDIAWSLIRLEDAKGIWDGAAAGTPGLTHPDFDGKSTTTLRQWLDWWSDPSRSPEGKEEDGRDPAQEAAKLRAELEARGVEPP